MPQISPITPESTITLQANTQMASTKMAQAEPSAPEPVKAPETISTTPSEGTKPEQDAAVLKARLFQERMRRQLDAERKKIELEKRDLELQRATSRKWQEAAELAQSGRYIEAAEKAGLTYDQLTQQILNGGQVPPQRIAEQTASELVRRELEAFKAEQQKQGVAAREQQMQEARQLIQIEVKNLVDTTDKYPLAKEGESYQDVVSYIESEFRRTGRVMPVEEALQRWEAEVSQGLEILLSQEKIRSSILKETPKPAQETSVPQTLSQRAMAHVPAPKPISDAERRQRAIDAFYSRLP